ncbi:MAG: hypothetical protein A2X84_13560 [Desulfuromonadaceae bacterium GWC2_58_13]|nr:MAG: hypothetical protein A2X84_13560 [Desulfuromonadaceae bacterium GWC2_58_13]
MTQAEIYQATTNKTLIDYVAALDGAATRRGFTIHNRGNMAMAETYLAHNLPMPADFDLHMIQVCKPEKSSQSFQANIERAPLMPKFIMVFSKEGATRVRFLAYSKELISALVPGDAQFPESLVQTYAVIREMIDEAL